MNLNVFIAKSGLCSRRKADELIKDGKVRVNGAAIREPWYKVKSEDALTVAGRPLAAEKLAYLVLNKPKGVTSTVADRFAERTVIDMVPEQFGRVYPAGRLDRDTRGLIILTNDGDLCYELTHPKFEVEKEYLATVEGKMGRQAIDRMKKGIRDEGELLKVKSVVVAKPSGDRFTAHVIIAEGKKRHIRRIFKCVGCIVVDLVRIRIGELTLGDLKEGHFKPIGRRLVYRLLLGKDIGE